MKNILFSTFLLFSLSSFSEEVSCEALEKDIKSLEGQLSLLDKVMSSNSGVSMRRDQLLYLKIMDSKKSLEEEFNTDCQ